MPSYDPLPRFTGSLAAQLFAEAPTLCSDWSQEADDGFESLRGVVEQHHEELAAVIIEPVVQGAGGMRIYHPNYLRKLRELCDDYEERKGMGEGKLNTHTQTHLT